MTAQPVAPAHDAVPTEAPVAPAQTWPASGDWAGWSAVWEARMQAFFPHRSACITAITDVLAEVLPDGPWRILDLGAGTGSLSKALLDRFPAAQVVALDLDPVMMAVGRGAHADAGDRLTWRQVNLRDADWPEQVNLDAGPTVALGGSERVDGASNGTSAAPFDAVVSLATLHHFSGAEVDGIYRDLARLIVPGGLLLNAEALAPAPAASRLSQAFDAARRRTMVPADGFWEAIAADAALAEAVAERERLRGQMHGAGKRLTAEAHRRALRRAGFAETAVAWRHLDEALVVGLR